MVTPESNDASSPSAPTRRDSLKLAAAGLSGFTAVGGLFSYAAGLWDGIPMAFSGRESKLVASTLIGESLPDQKALSSKIILNPAPVLQEAGFTQLGGSCFWHKQGMVVSCCDGGVISVYRANTINKPSFDARDLVGNDFNRVSDSRRLFFKQINPGEPLANRYEDPEWGRQPSRKSVLFYFMANDGSAIEFRHRLNLDRDHKDLQSQGYLLGVERENLNESNFAEQSLVKVATSWNRIWDIASISAAPVRAEYIKPVPPEELLDAPETPSRDPSGLLVGGMNTTEQIRQIKTFRGRNIREAVAKKWAADNDIVLSAGLTHQEIGSTLSYIYWVCAKSGAHKGSIEIANKKYNFLLDGLVRSPPECASPFLEDQTQYKFYDDSKQYAVLYKEGSSQGLRVYPYSGPLAERYGLYQGVDCKQVIEFFGLSKNK